MWHKNPFTQKTIKIKKDIALSHTSSNFFTKIMTYPLIIFKCRFSNRICFCFFHLTKILF